MTDLTQRLFSAFSERSRIAYERDRNPLHVWQTINNAEVAGIEIPTWCRYYLHDVALKLLAIRDASTVDQAVKSAIGIDGRHVKSYPRAHAKTSKQRAYNRVNELVRLQGMSPGKAIEKASDELGIGVNAVRNYYYAVKKRLEVLFATA